MITADPNDTPDTVPVVRPTEAMEGALEVQVPLPPAVKVTDAERHTATGPVIGAGRLLTVNIDVV